MSIKRTTAVWDESNHKGSTLLLLLAIADNADEDGLAWPGIETLMKRTRTGKRAVIAQIQRAEASGELRVYRRPGLYNFYVLDIGLSVEQREACIRRIAERTKDSVEQIRGELYAPVNQGSPVETGVLVNQGSPGGESGITSTGESGITRSVIRTVKEPKDSADMPDGSQQAACESPPPLEDSQPKPDQGIDPVKPEKTAKPPTPHQAMFEAVTCGLGLDLDTLTPDRKGTIGKTASALRKANATPDQIPGFMAWLEQHAEKEGWRKTPDEHSMRRLWPNYAATLKPRPVKRLVYNNPPSEAERIRRLNELYASEGMQAKLRALGVPTS